MSAAQEIWTCARGDELYPAALGVVYQPPEVLYGRGDRELLAEIAPAVTVVGARRASRHGGEVTSRLAADLCAAGLTVVSGMAIGIDSWAHEGALEAGGRTVAVLGGGADVVYPRAKRHLYERIAEHGLVLSEQPPGTEPAKWMFPARNRIMAALGRLTVVVEAAQRSGSLITARLAAEIGRDVGAVPGRVGTPLAAGTNHLLADGAIVVRDAQDILDAVLGAGAPRLERSAPELSRDQAAVLDLVGRGHTTPDAVAAASGMAVGGAIAALASLELLGRLVADGSGRYSVSP